MGKTVKEKQVKNERDAVLVRRKTSAMHVEHVHVIGFSPLDESESRRVMRYVGIKLAILDAAKEFSEHISVETPEPIEGGVECAVKSKYTGRVQVVRVPSVPGYNTEDLERYARDAIRLAASFIRIRTDE
jgi:hypothetical protein